MHYTKKLNLLPQSYKDKYINKYLLFSFGALVAIMLLIMLTVYSNYFMLNFSIKRLITENTEFQNRQTKITTLKEAINKNTSIINEQQKEGFPFYSFMQTVEKQKPYGLTIISIDSSDRLLTPAPQNEADITYEKDLSKDNLVVRGYSQNPSDIAEFINTLAQLSYVEDIELKAIEEHTIDGVNSANIFEAILKLK